MDKRIIWGIAALLLAVLLNACTEIPAMLVCPFIDTCREQFNASDAATPIAVKQISFVSARGVDRNGCAVDETTVFESTDPIYVIAIDNHVPEGTRIFVRLLFNDTPLEDAPEIIADREYRNICINFVFESNTEFEAGNYEAQFIVNGQLTASTSFSVRG